MDSNKNSDNTGNKGITVLIIAGFLVGLICLFAALVLMRDYDPNERQIKNNVDIEWHTHAILESET